MVLYYWYILLVLIKCNVKLWIQAAELKHNKIYLGTYHRWVEKQHDAQLPLQV